MLRAGLAFVTIVLGVALVVGTGTSGDSKKPKGQLPSGWKKLDLSKEQVLKIYAVQGTYKNKIKKLEEELKDLKTQERKEMLKVLTEDQKEKLRQILLGETP